MGIRQEINAILKGLCKQAQVLDNYAPANNQQSAVNLAKKIPNMAWGTLGVGGGLAKGVWDRTLGDGAQGSWKDYLREGWNAGFNHGDMAAAGMVEGIANMIPFVEQKTIPSFVDFVRNEKINSGMQPEVADVMRTGGNYAGIGATALPSMKVLGWAGKILGNGATRFAELINAGNRTKNIMQIAGRSAPVASLTAVGAQDAYQNGASADKAEASNLILRAIDQMQGLSPSSPEYAQKYEALKRLSEEHGVGEFSQLIPPS